MSERIASGSLVLYKSRPARVTEVSDKITISLAGAKPKRVREKDVVMLHPGPVADLEDLDAASPNIDEAWELTCGEIVSLADLSDLLFGEFTPATAWSSWQLVADGLYFEGTPEGVTGRTAEAVAVDRAERESKAARQAAWEGLLNRVRKGTMEEGDRRELAEVERLALSKAQGSRILQALDLTESPEYAHRLLVRVGYWKPEHNPYPERFGAPRGLVLLDAPPMPEEERFDLTHLPAYAIDDEGNEDPDDAISLDGDRLWVHVADVAALIAPDSELDVEARARGANLYLPEGIVGMLPDEVTRRLGLGLAPVSPALSIGMRVDESGGLEDIQIRLTRIAVERLSYREANGRLGEGPLGDIHAVTRRYRARRMANGAARIDLPEASVRLQEGEIRIRPIESLASREMVTDAMVMAGEAVARYALAHELAVPFVGQPTPEQIREPATPAAMFEYRRLFKPSSASTTEQAHFGLGLPVYTRSTSPLRRYLDLLTHQQLRAHLGGQTPMDRAEVGRRIAESEPGSATIRRTERFSNQHWKLAFLRRNPGWQGEAVVLGLEERRATVVIPELALETKLRRTPEMVLDGTLRLEVRDVDLTDLSVRFRVLPA